MLMHNEVIKKLSEQYSSELVKIQNLSLPNIHNSRLKSIFDNNQFSSTLGIDIGGSGVRFASFSHEGTKVKLSSSIFSNKFEGQELTFLDWQKQIFKFFQETDLPLEYDAIGLTYSFPANYLVNNNNIDADRSSLSDVWGKNFEVHDSAKNISESLRIVFVKNGITFSRWITINDIVALMLAAPSVDIGLIIGTGYNLGANLGQNLFYNLEAGTFYSPLMRTLFRQDLQQLFDKFEKPAIHPKFTEMFVGTKSLVDRLTDVLGNNDEFSKEDVSLIYKFQGRIFDMVINETLEGNNFGKVLSNNQRRILSDTIAGLVEGSSSIVASQIAGVCNNQSLKTIRVAFGGSFVENIPQYLNLVSNKLANIFDITVEFYAVENPSLIGAAKSVLLSTDL